MIRRLTLLALLACCGLTGCASLDLFRPSRGDRSLSGNSTYDFEFTDSGVITSDSGVKVMQEAARMGHDFMVQQIAKTRPGSTVGLHTTSDHRITGTVLKMNSTGMELMNCICQEKIPGPDGQMQCKTSHIPFRVLSTDDITHYIVVTPPSGDFSASSLSRDKGNYTVDSIVFMSGLRLRCPTLPERDDSQQTGSSLQELQSVIDSAQIGSQVYVVDESYHPYVGTLESTESDRIQLVNCIDVEATPPVERSGHRQFKTNLVPFRSFSMSSMNSFRVLSSPATDSGAAKIGEDSADFCFAEFVFKSGRCQSYGRPPGVAASDRRNSPNSQSEMTR